MFAPETERCDEGDTFDEADATSAVAVAKSDPVPARDALAAIDSSGDAEKLPPEERDTMELGDSLPAADAVATLGVADCVELGREEPETDGASEALTEGSGLRLGNAGEPVPAELGVGSAVSEVVGRADALAERAPEGLAEKTGLPLGSGEPDS